jgi:pimeloyl-ACP methyl ester carboxylesterase
MGTGAPVLCVPGFADSGASWLPLTEALALRCEVAVLELPGFGEAPPQSAEVTVAGFAEVIADVARRTWAGPVTLLGHSLGAALAVRAAHHLAEHCAAMVSIEGNLTAQDSYFSGQATRHDAPAAFKHAFAEQVRTLVADGRAPATYAESVAVADPLSMWSLGRDAIRQGAADGYGRDFATLGHRAVYLWSSTTTPPATQEFLRAHRLQHRQLTIEHHWPWTVRPDTIADLVHAATPAPPA